MKKFIANIVLVFYIMFSFVASGMASELYYIKNANKDNVIKLAENNFKTAGYTIKNNDPLYGIKSDGDAVVIVQQTENDLYYYFDSTSDKNINKSILKSFSNNGLKYKKNKNSAISSSLAKEEIALKKSLSGNMTTYNFENQTASTATQKTATGTKKVNGGSQKLDEVVLNLNQNTSGKYEFADDEDALTGYVAQLPVGTTVDVYLQSTVNTASAQKGDEVKAVLTKNLEYNGHVIAGQGSVVTGSVTKANAAGMAYRDGVVKFNFNKLTTPEGKVYNISTDEIEFKIASTGKASSVTGKVAGGVLAGALLGLIAGALTGDGHNIGKATAIGAGAGAAWGAGSAVLEKGSDAEIPTYTEMTLTLTSPLNVVVSN